MAKPITLTKLPPIIFAILGLVLILVSYFLAGGQNRLMPMYGFPEPAFGCNFEDIGTMTTVQPPELSRGYLESELLWCYPQQYFMLYVFAIVGTGLCGWSLISSGKSSFRSEERTNISLSDPKVALPVSFAMIVTGIRVFKLEFDIVGGSVPRPPDIFNGLALIVFFMGILVLSFA